MERCTHSVARATSRWRRRSEHSSPRRNLVIIVSQSNLPGGRGPQRPALVALGRPAATQVPAALQSGVEALQQLRVQPAVLHRPQPRVDVDPDQILVPLPGRDLQVGDLQPLLQGLPDRDRRLRVQLLVDLALRLAERRLSITAGQKGCPRQDSNLRSRLRRAVLYPLSYGGPFCAKCANKRLAHD